MVFKKGQTQLLYETSPDLKDTFFDDLLLAKDWPLIKFHWQWIINNFRKEKVKDYSVK